MRLLIGSAIRQSPAVLAAFLRSLAGLNLHGLDVQFSFVDANQDPDASALLRGWAAERSATVVAGETADHQAVWQAARTKDALIEYVLAEGFDLLFLTDANLVLHPFTIQQLLAAKRPVVAEIAWRSDLPQVWLQDGSVQADPRSQEWLAQLREPGLYPVGGVGAPILLHREALAAGCRFAEIYNLSLPSEEQHFSIRAAALGFQLWVETSMPAYRIGNEGDLDGVEEYLRAAASETAPRLVKQVAQAGLEAWGTSDWRTVTGLEGADYLARNLRARQVAEASDVVTQTKAVQSVARTRVEQAEVVDLDDAAGEALVRCWLVNEGEERGEAFADRLQAVVVLVKEEDRWLIGSVEFYPTEQAAATE